jgi:hypothetical protein
MSQHWDDRNAEDLERFIEELNRREPKLPATVVLGRLAIAALEGLNQCELCDTRSGVMVLRNAGRICGTCWAVLDRAIARLGRRNGTAG